MVLLEIDQSPSVTVTKVKVSFNRIAGAKFAPFCVMVHDSRSGLEVSRKLRYENEELATQAFQYWVSAIDAHIDGLFAGV